MAYGWGPYVPVRDPTPEGRARDGKAPEEGPPGLARRPRGPHHRPDLLGPELVPTTSSATATTRTVCRGDGPMSATARSSTSRSRRGEVVARVAGSRLYRSGWRWRRCPGPRGPRSPRTARAASTRSSSCCRDGSRRASWSASAAQETACSPRRRDPVRLQLPRLRRRCASTSPPCSTASALGSTSSPSCCSSCAGVDGSDLIARAGKNLPLARKGQPPGRVLDAEGLSELFGLDLAEAPVSARPWRARPGKRRARSR